MQHDTLGNASEICLPSLDSEILHADFVVRTPGHRIGKQQIVSSRSRASVASGCDLPHVMAVGLTCSKGNSKISGSSIRWCSANLNNAGVVTVLDS